MLAALTVRSEIFGVSEDETPEFDHSEDSENGMFDNLGRALCGSFN